MWLPEKEGAQSKQKLVIKDPYTYNIGLKQADKIIGNKINNIWMGV